MVSENNILRSIKMLNPTLQKYVAAIALTTFFNLNLHSVMAAPSALAAED